MPALDVVAVGDRIPEDRRRLTQMDLVMYAGASGDFNPLHWDPEFAASVSPTGGIIAHGMLNLGQLSRVVTQWAGGPDHIRRLSGTFRAPCPVGATVVYGGEVIGVDPENRTATLAVWAELEDGSRIIDRRSSRAVVGLD
jgi:acyl dehydratase